MLKHLSRLQEAGIFIVLTLASALALTLTHQLLFLAFYVFTPALVAVFMLLVVTKEGHTKKYWQEFGLFKPGIRFWPLAIILPVIIFSLSYFIVWHLNPASYRNFAFGRIVTTASYFLGMTIYQAITVTLGEEIGWRGYLLPRLMTLGKTKAYLIGGLVWAAWHLPLIFIANVYNIQGNKLVTTIFFTGTILALNVICNELRLRSHSLWPASLLHSAHNVVWGLLVSASFATPFMIYFGGESGVITVILYLISALLVVTLPAGLGAFSERKG